MSVSGTLFQHTTNKFLASLPPGLAEELKKVRNGTTNKTTAYFADEQAQRSITLTEILQWKKLPEPVPGLLIVKNISLAWIPALSDVLGVDLSFFREHAVSPRAATPWDAVFPHGAFEKRKAAADKSDQTTLDYESDAPTLKSWHVDGVIEYCTYDRESSSKRELLQDNIFPRLLWHDNAYGWNASVRFSYCLAAPNLHLLLVDSPPSFLQYQAGQEYNKLWLPLSDNRGGVMLPALYGSSGATMLDTFDAFGSHAWHIRALAGLPAAGLALTPAMFFYLVITSTWQTNLRTLRNKLEHVAFKEIRRPNIQINDSLHDLRQYLTYLRAQVVMTKQWIPRSVTNQVRKLKQALPPSEYVGEPPHRFEEILSEAKSTDRFLMDSFQLLMSSMGVLDAQRSLSQTSRTQKVTTLAFVYVPLSFVTGVFGMNVAEINGSTLSVWVPAVVLVITAICTAVVFSWSGIVARIWGKRESIAIPS